MGRAYKIINRRKLHAVRSADLVLDQMARIGLLGRRPGSSPVPLPAEVDHILMIRFAYVGDVILTLPAVQPLRARFPGARIHLLTSRGAGELVADYPGIDRVITFDPPWFYPRVTSAGWLEVRRLIRELKRGAYQLGIDFRGDIRNIMFGLFLPGIPHRLSYSSGGGEALLTHPVPWRRWKHKAEFHLDILREAGIPCELRPPELQPGPAGERELERVCPALFRDDDRPLVVVHPGARVALKRWPASEYRSLVTKLIRHHEIRVVITGDAGERHLCRQVVPDMVRGEVLNLAGQLTIRGLAALLARARVLVSNDSMPMHLGAAVGTRVVAVFGPSKPRETAPLGEGHRVVVKYFPCRYTCDELRCRYEHHRACLKAITPTEVLRAVEPLLV